MMARRYAEEVTEIIKSYKDDPSTDIVHAITTLSSKRSEEILNHYRETRLPIRIRDILYLPTLHIQDRVYGSCLIAKKDENLLRYLSILEVKDPTITISGPDASYIKESLMKSLGT